MNCRIKGKSLGKHGCTAWHPTGGKRFRTKMPAKGPQGGSPSLCGAPSGESDLLKEVQFKQVCGGLQLQVQAKRQRLIGEFFSASRLGAGGTIRQVGTGGKRPSAHLAGGACKRRR